MQTKQQFIDDVRAAGCTAQTWAGMVRFARQHSRHSRPSKEYYAEYYFRPQRRQVGEMGGWRRYPQSTLPHRPNQIFKRTTWHGNDCLTEWRTPREMYYGADSRTRFLLRMERMARVAMDQFGLLDLEQTHQLHKAIGNDDSARRETARMKRMSAPKRAAHLARILAAPALSAELTSAYLKPIAQSIQSAWPFRQSESSWAGGEHSVSVRLADETPGVGSGTEKVWSDNGKWSGTNSYARLSVSRRALDLFPTLRTPDGSIILDAELVAPRTYRVTWLVQSRGCSVSSESGWIVRGYHVRAASQAQAERKAAKARQAAVSATLHERQARRDKAAALASYRHTYITLDDSIRAGNCKPISEQFAAQAWRTIGAVAECAVRADVVLSIRDDFYTRRALGAAMEHSHAAA
jgi:hypothetical protein